MRFTSTIFPCRLSVLGLGEQIQVVGQQSKIFKFARRAGRDVEEALKLGVSELAATLCKVRGNRSCAPANLTSQSAEFLPGKPARVPIDQQGYLVRFLPYSQVSKILQSSISFHWQNAEC
jgi:hypothetical protein